ncbi:MAG: glutamyl-tRNA reductase [Bacteroidia bacterium]|nr:glutamyl-tRNA reductase [Bacteroidia bacterium]
MHINQDEQNRALLALKSQFGFEELMYLSTCNRIELMLCGETELSNEQLKRLVHSLNARLTDAEINRLANGAEVLEAEEAISHVLKVASSLESLVIGEREIITQVRKAYEHCNALGLTGDFLRLLIKQTIETAKEIYTKTNIAKNPVSVASLAYRQLRDLGIKNEARIVFVGAGETNTTLAAYFKKHKFANFTVFNRSLPNAKRLALELQGNAFKLSEMLNYNDGFDVLIVCTGSSEAIISNEIYHHLRNQESGKKVIIDLSLPANVSPDISLDPLVNYIDINSIRERAEANLQLRKNEIEKCEEIIATKAANFNTLYRERKVELAFGAVPKQIRAIKDLAINEVFAKEINLLDDNGKAVLDKVLAYMEKKYNAVAIKTAKDVLLERN